MKHLTSRKILSAFLAAVMVVLAVPVTITSAELFTAGDFTYTVTDGEAKIVDHYDYGSTNVIIPSKLGGYPVTAIGNNAFYRDEEIKSVTIPDSVEAIGKNAFEDCFELSEITIGSGVKFIDTNAFTYSFDLAKVYIKDVAAWCGIEFANAGSNPLINGGAFYIDGSVAYEIVIPEGVESIGNYTFENCGTVTAVSLPDSLKSIGNRAFAGCYSLENMIIPDSVETIGNSAFAGCSNIAEVAIPAGVKSIGENAFYGSALTAINVKEGNTVYKSVDGVLFSHDGSVLYRYPSGKKADTYTVPDGVTTIERKAFSYCSGTSEIIIPGSVTSIGTDAFYSSKKLKSVTVGEGITAISDGTFNMCTGLESVTIGKNVSFIGEDAFRDCASLKDIHISDIAAWCSIEYSSGLYSKPFYYAENMYLDGELVENLVIPDGVTTIGDNAFYGCEGLKSVTVSGTVKTIGSYAFYLCKNLTSVTVLDGVTHIENAAFYLCENLETVSLPDSVTDIGYRAFHFTKLFYNEDNWDNGFLYIGNHLIKAAIPEDEEEDFYPPRPEENIIIKDGTLNIAYGAFSEGYFISSVFIPESVKHIEDKAFYGCSKIKDLYYGGSIDDFSQISIGVNNEAITAEAVRMHYNVTDPKDHYKCNVTKEPSCLGSGTCEYVCSCGYSNGTETLPSLGHDLTDHPRKDATCTDAGHYSYKSCSRCSYTTYKEIAKTEHEYENGTCTHCGNTPGDVTDDGKVNLTDVSLLLKHIAGWDVDINSSYADVSGDGKATLADVSLMLKYIAGWDVVLHSPAEN